MEPLRWILLVAGIAFVFFLYLFGRKHYQRKRDMDDIELDDDDLPEFNARNWDDFDEGVGPVRVITGAGADPDNDHPGADKTQNDNVSMSDIIVMYILPKLDNIFPGSQINSSVQAMGLKFGEMNIYHFKNGERTVFSLANMHEPGHFDPNTIHDMKSTGLTVFMQINTSADVDAIDDLTEMLQRSYQLAGLLEGRLCNHLRQPLTEQDAENYREQVRALTAK